MAGSGRVQNGVKAGSKLGSRRGQSWVKVGLGGVQGEIW